MDKAVIDHFWRQRSALGMGRWTGNSMLAFELDLLAPLVGPNCRILDLGSGAAELSRNLLLDSSRLLAVDRYPSFLESIPDDSRISKQCSDLGSFATTDKFDLILLFGVVTHLEIEEEVELYRKVRSWLNPGGIFVVKHQVSRAAELSVDDFSEALQCRYVARYPNVNSQANLLRAHFNTVKTVSYPEALNHWPTTMHLAFLCSGAR
ncbi:MAG: class I SAM-dependent methyltransferase [Accumulibacter sp.]|jgi:2-polyprenyl-3-methyl-5-hydroxy-6-metoxy-1,4-benzoquinol methylase|uniref:class I SAM-dependent methyltransferase n=1 Tax=Accumulibacter sp. TaxID=2053492 RepID=UPI002FC33094